MRIAQQIEAGSKSGVQAEKTTVSTRTRKNMNSSAGNEPVTKKEKSELDL